MLNNRDLVLKSGL